jgi:hypothetical protein
VLRLQLLLLLVPFEPELLLLLLQQLPLILPISILIFSYSQTWIIKISPDIFCYILISLLPIFPTGRIVRGRPDHNDQ